MQDDILTDLAKIADLKVISRTSVMEYRGKRNIRQIGNDYGYLTFWRAASVGSGHGFTSMRS